MPINDAFMLPKRVRTMEQMADLLQTEQTELTQTQRTIAALEQQLNISTSTFLLPRHERLFELPVNTTESLEARRAKVDCYGERGRGGGAFQPVCLYRHRLYAV